MRPEPLQEDTIGLEGSWTAREESVESHNEKSVLHLQFHATEVNLVLSPVDTSAIIQVSFNNLPLERDFAGTDLTQASEIEVGEPRMYNLFKSRERAEGILSIKSVKGTIRAFAFTFSGCEE